MRSTLIFGFALTMILSSASLAQEWEIGALAGGALYRDATITNPRGSAQAGMESGFAIGAILGQNMYNYVSGELRYMFMVGQPVLRFSGIQANTSGYTNVVNYDLLVHTSPRESKIRPFFAVGGGVKIYSATSRFVLTQPLKDFAALSAINEVEPMFSVGGGLKYMVWRNVQLRGDFRTFMSPMPNHLFRSTFPSTIHGWIYNFVPTAGVSYVF